MKNDREDLETAKEFFKTIKDLEQTYNCAAFKIECGALLLSPDDLSDFLQEVASLQGALAALACNIIAEADLSIRKAPVRGRLPTRPRAP